METTFDLSPYIARGFGDATDAALANIGVAGIDREQTQSMIRLCPETESVLYGVGRTAYSPTGIRYRSGARPKLEAISRPWRDLPPRQQATAAMDWVCHNVTHPHVTAPTAVDRALSEEGLIDSGCGWCNEQSRVFIALCQTLELPTRLVFLFHANKRCGHTTTEVWLDGRWAFFDVTFNVTVPLPDGRLAEARELAGDFRALAHAAYRDSLLDYFSRSLPFVESMPGWRRADRPAAERGGDLLDDIGICNYLIDGVTVKP